MLYQIVLQFFLVTFGSMLAAWIGTEMFRGSDGCGFRMIWAVFLYPIILASAVGQPTDHLAVFAILLLWSLICGSLATEFNEVNIAEGGYVKEKRAIVCRLAVVLGAPPLMFLFYKWGMFLLTSVFYGTPTVLSMPLSAEQQIWLAFSGWSFVVAQAVAFYLASGEPFSAERFRRDYPEFYRSEFTER